MLPDWLQESDSYVPPADGGTFAVRTIKTMGQALARIQIQRGHEKKFHLPALVKLFLMVGLIVLTSVTQNRMVLLALLAGLLAYMASWPAKDLWSIIRGGLSGAVLALILFIPAMIIHPAGMWNNLLVVGKVFMSVCFVGIFNHTTQWNHITGALRKLHIPGIFVFTLDITLKYIVLLGNLIMDLLTSLQLRSVGKNNKKYTSVGGVMGVTFLRAAEMNREMYEAMQCRCFTDDYKGL